MKRIVTTYAAVCLLTGGLLYTAMPTVVASPAQLVNRTAQEAARTPTRPKPTDARQTPVKSSPEAAVAKTPKKDAPGKRFWSRIMSHFRDIHSAEKKQK